MSSMLRYTMWGASALVLVSVAGCGGPEFQDAPPPPSAYVEQPMPAPYAAPQGRVETTELLGGPAPQAPAPYRIEAAPGYATMAPIPNPEDMTRAERARVYGAAERATGAKAASRSQGRAVARVPQADRPTVAATTRPVAVASPSGPVTKQPVAPAPKPAAPVVAAPTAKPAAPQVAAKTPTPVAVPAKPAKPQTKAEQLGAAIAADVTSGAKFDIPEGVVAGQPGVVVLTLPEGLLGRVQAEAAKLGLTVPARTVDTRATLTGEGYTIIPNASQAARLKDGEATSFAWQVNPGAGTKGPLKAEIGGELKGGAKPVAFPITTIEQVIPTAPAPAEPAKSGFDWRKFFGLGKDKAQSAASDVGDAASKAGNAVSDGAESAAAKSKSFIDRVSIPGSPTVTVPAFGEVRSGNVVLVGLGVLALIILAALGRAAGERRRAAERRRKFRTMADFGSKDEPVSETHEEPAETHAESHEKREPEHA